MATSARSLQRDLLEGKIIYGTPEPPEGFQRNFNGSVGVNTGFGGSANTRTQRVESLQESLVMMLQCGSINPSPDSQGSHLVNGHDSHCSSSVEFLRRGLPLDDPVSASCMPVSWTRAAILIRINSLMRGVSSARPVIASRIAELLNQDIIPRIPIHGSISASGDLSPSSYIAGCIQGKSNISVLAGKERQIMSAKVAMARAGLSPVSLAAKEGLAIVNGTAFSAGTSALVMHEAFGLSALSQVLNAMSVEALAGSAESFHPYFAAVNPHPGQTESADNTRKFSIGSRLIRENDGKTTGALRQDRYSIRTASQWVGPVLEDTNVAYHQIIIECNAVTGNALTTPEGDFIHGGNFQAGAVTSAMEKTSQGFQSLGRISFAQCTELINPATNNGLPPNLTADPPSESFIMKGVDILCASLLSELGFLANPVGSHVQTADMGNQALNSLALISARYTHIAADLLSLLSAAHLLIVCQALDLRAMHSAFLSVVEPSFHTLTSESFGFICKIPEMHSVLWPALLFALDAKTTEDPATRFGSTASSLQAIILPLIDTDKDSPCIPLLFDWMDRVTALLCECHEATLAAYLDRGDASPLLGRAARRIYLFVRKDLKVPFFHEKMLRAPAPGSGNHELAATGKQGHVLTIDDHITVLHEAIRQGVLNVPVMEALEEARDALTAERDEINHVPLSAK